MTKFLKTASVIILFILAHLMVDQKLLGSYFLSKITAYPKLGEIKNEKTNITYQVKKVADDRIELTIHNQSLIPKYLLGFRYYWVVPKDIDERKFRLASRKSIRAPLKRSKDSYGFGCGTGVGVFSLNSNEKITKEKSYSEIFQLFQISDLYFKKDANYYYDIFYGKPIFTENADRELILVEDVKVTDKDSIDVKFYLPTYSIFNGNQTDNYSNGFKISYLDLITHHIEK